MLKKIRDIISPLLRLGRFDKPIGITLLLFPCWWGVALESGLAFDGNLLFLFAFGATIMRAAGCIINDIFDMDVDAQVVRTKDRPLACKEVSIKTAILFLMGLLFFGLLVLIQLPYRCWVLGLLATCLATLYPLAKRVTSCPQLVLGITFNFGVLVGAAAVTPDWIHGTTFMVYGAAILWTLAYDTIYALQDINDDKKLGIGSTALLFGTYIKEIVGLCYIVMHGLLLTVIFLSHQTPLSPIGYGLLSLSLTFSLYRLYNLNLNNTSHCREFFISNQWIGMLVFLSLLSVF